MLTPHATAVSALGALISAVAVVISTIYIIATFYRKTKRDRIDDLKPELQEIFAAYRYKGLVDMSEVEIYSELKSKFQKSKYESLHRAAYDELTNEGKNTHVNAGRRLNEGLNQLAQAQNRREP